MLTYVLVLSIEGRKTKSEHYIWFSSDVLFFVVAYHLWKWPVDPFWANFYSRNTSLMRNARQCLTSSITYVLVAMLTNYWREKTKIVSIIYNAQMTSRANRLHRSVTQLTTRCDVSILYYNQIKEEEFRTTYITVSSSFSPDDILPCCAWAYLFPRLLCQWYILHHRQMAKCLSHLVSALLLFPFLCTVIV